MAVGYITVNVVTSRAKIPIQGAFVAITSGHTPNVNLLGFRTTNENGKTGLIALRTPTIASSLIPEDGEPFSLCDIRITHPFYYTTLIKDVQVFTNIKTLQECNLIPLMENTPPDQRLITINTPAQNL